MMDRTQLTEALSNINRNYANQAGAAVVDVMPLMEAARLLLDFPTDEMVEAVLALLQDEADTRQVLRVVRRVMFGET
jgi:hypothetical protein